MYRLKINHEESPIQQFDCLPECPFVVKDADGIIYLVSQAWSGIEVQLTQLSSQNIGKTYCPYSPEELLNDINNGVYVVKKSNLIIE